MKSNKFYILRRYIILLLISLWGGVAYCADLHHINKNNSINDDTETSSFYNPSIDLHKQKLRVLDIGNSFTQDSQHYLPQLAENLEIDLSDMCLYSAIRASGSFKSWYDIYHDSDPRKYSIYKCLGELNYEIEGVGNAYDGSLFRNALSNVEWDLIIIHQVSTYSAYYDQWNTTGPGGYLQELLQLLREAQPNATIGFLLVHSTASTNSGNAEHSTFERWKLISESAQHLKEDYNIDFIIPYGTAIESLRATDYNNEWELTEDDLHLSAGLADYTASCTYFEKLLAPRYGKSVLGNSLRLTNLKENYSIDVTDENAYIAQLCAVKAVEDWSHIADIPIAATEIILTPERTTLEYIGQSTFIQISVIPDTAMNKTVIWGSSNDEVATVDENGRVLALSNGETIISATCGDAEAKVTINVCTIEGPNSTAFFEKEDYREDSTINNVVSNPMGSWETESINLTDAYPIFLPYDFEAANLTYIKELNDSVWHPLYVPFNSNYESWKSKALIARLNQAFHYDDDNDGVDDRIVLEFVCLNPDDTVMSNLPYIIKPILNDVNTDKAITFDFNNVQVSKTPETQGSVECSSMTLCYTITGVYDTINELSDPNTYIS